MKTNSRFVVINTKEKTAKVYDGRVFLAQYDFTGELLTKEEIEFVRTQEFKGKA